MKSNYKRFDTAQGAKVWYDWCVGCGKFSHVDVPERDYDGSYWVSYYK